MKPSQTHEANSSGDLLRFFCFFEFFGFRFRCRRTGDDIKPCPRCQVLIAKMDDGSCNHMTCALCGAEFCWLCMKEISDLHYLRYNPTPQNPLKPVQTGSNPLEPTWTHSNLGDQRSALLVQQNPPKPFQTHSNPLKPAQTRSNLLKPRR